MIAFVYGTLKTNQNNNAVLGDSEFLGSAETTSDDYRYTVRQAGHFSSYKFGCQLLSTCKPPSSASVNQ